MNPQFFLNHYFGAVPHPFCPYILFLLAQKRTKKGRSYLAFGRLRGKRLRSMGFNRFEQPGIAFILHSKRLTP